MSKRNIFLGLMLASISMVSLADFVKMPKLEKARKVKEATLLRDLNIPSVRERSIDPNSGPRLDVAEFRIQGMLEYPELGITREAVQALMDEVRFELMGEGELLKSGYTIDELGELSDLLVQIEEETLDRHVTNIEVQKLIWLIRAQRGKRGVTLGQIEAVANRITRFYRERGFILAKAYLPKQEVRDGVVNLTILLGMLGEINVHGNDSYSRESLTSVFSGNMLKPVTSNEIEENLYILNGYPGLTVEGYFEAGAQVGDTLLNINVKDEQKYNLNTRFDNHGTDESGLYRLFVTGQVNNLLGNADLLRVSALQAVSPENTTFGRLEYESNFLNPRMRLAMSYSQNQFIVDQSSGSNVDLNGTVDVAGISGRYLLQRSRKRNSSVELRYENISSDLQLGDLPDINDFLDEKLSQVSLVYNFDILNDVKQRLHVANITYTNGSVDFGVKQGQEEKYHLIKGDYTLLNFINVPFSDSKSKLILRASAQYSGINLSSTARFSLTGPTRNRGFSPSLFTADDAVYLGADWVFNSPSAFDFSVGSYDFTNSIRPFVFIDYAWGQQYTLDGSEEHSTAHLADLGVGLEFSIREFSGNLLLGVPVVDKYSYDNPLESDGFRVLFNFQYAIF